MRKNDFVLKELRTQEERLKYIDGLMAGRASTEAYPRRIYIEPTNRCNRCCLHCPGSSFMTRPKGLMDFALYTKIINEAAPFWDRTSINLYEHGEPLLHPRIYDMIDYAQERNLFVKMNTNLGALRKEDIPRLLRLNYLEVSLDAATAETYRTVKGSDGFDRTLDNLMDLLIAWGESATSESYAIDVSFLSQRANHHEVEVFRDMFSRLPVGHVNVGTLHNFTGAIAEGAAACQKAEGLPRSQWPCCNTPWDILGINWDGQVVACVYDYDQRYVIGNMATMGILDCWNSQAMQRFRQGLLDRDYGDIERNGPLCSQCSILWLPGYSIPTDYLEELGRMETYLVNAVRRVAKQKERHASLMERHAWLKANRRAWMDELRERAQAARVDQSVLPHGAGGQGRR